jgi:hypothetical protein
MVEKAISGCMIRHIAGIAAKSGAAKSNAAAHRRPWKFAERFIPLGAAFDASWRGLRSASGARALKVIIFAAKSEPTITRNELASPRSRLASVSNAVCSMT